MDPKKLAMILGIAILLPLFVGLFVDAIYSSPDYDDFCSGQRFFPTNVKPIEECNFDYGPDYQSCLEENGNPILETNDQGCNEFKECDFCNNEYQDAKEKYNRNLFFIIAPIGLILVILGLYFKTDYMGAGLMFAGLIVLFYGTIRAFSDLSKIWRALVILVELIIIMWIGYKKIEKWKYYY